MSALDYADELARLSRLLDQGLQAMRDQAREYATAEDDYRRVKAEAFLQAPAGTVPEKEAWVNDRTREQRRRRDLAEGMKQAALEAVRSRRAQISALQTMVNAEIEEAKYIRTGAAA